MMTDSELYVTKHAFERARERCGFGKKTIARMSEKAFDQGLSPEDLHGRLLSYVNDIYFRTKSKNNVRIYGRFVYVFADRNLVTLIEIPKDLRYDVDRLMKKKKATE